MQIREYEKSRAAEIAGRAVAEGFRAFLAEAGNYGFYTDLEGTRVVSFQVNGYEERVSGNYVTNKAQQTGTGWVISDGIRFEKLRSYLDERPPKWAVGDATWNYATLENQMERYNKSSRYEEVNTFSQT